MALNWNNRTDYWSLALILAGFCAVAAILLAWVSAVTAPAIKAAEERTQNQALLQVLPSELYNTPSACTATFPAVDDPTIQVTFYGAFDADGTLLGVAGQSISKSGYGGPVEVLVGMNPDGAIRTVESARSAVLVTKSNETPGLGSVVATRATQRTLTTLFDPADAMPGNPILDKFAGQTAGDTPWQVSKDGGDFAYKTGATITSRAVTGAVYRVAATYTKNRLAVIERLTQANGAN